MKLGKTGIKRLAIYFFYDKYGVVDDYVIYFLTSLKKSCEDIIFVSNGKLKEDSLVKLNKISGMKICERENKGFDVWAYIRGFEEVGWENIRKYDEVVTTNFTIMGPIYPFSEMFSEMNKRDVDFWGITKHHKIPFDIFNGRTPDGIDEHIQSSFMVFRKSLIQSEAFKNHWDNMPEIKHYYDAICFHEAIFTKKFEKLGYKWSVYVNTDDLEGVAFYPLQMTPLDLIKNRKCPIFKRRNFFHDYQAFINYTVGEPTYEMFEYIKNKTDYDTDMIWQNVLRTMNHADFKNAMQLNFVLSTENPPVVTHKRPKTALLMHLYFMDLLDEMLHYAKSMPEDSDVYITTDSQDKKRLIEEKFKELKCNKLKVIVIENRGRDVSARWVEGRKFLLDYDYVCMAHDKKVEQLSPKTIGKSFAYQCLENVLKNKIFVKNVIETFEKNERLGALMPPPPFHADYFPTLGKEWRGSFKDVKSFLDKYNIKTPIDETKEPIAPFGSIFWFRPLAFKILFDCKLKYIDFPEEPIDIDRSLLHVIERVQGGLITQASGYYVGWLLSDTYAKIYLTNLVFTVREFNKVMFKNGIESTQYNMCGELNRRLERYKELEEENKALKRSIETGEVSLKSVLKRYITQKLGKK